MRITFVLPFVAISGGVGAIFKFANRLHDLGHQVTVVYPCVPLCSGPRGYRTTEWVNRIGGTLKNMFRSRNRLWFPLRAPLIRVPVLIPQFIPDGDVIIASWWETAYSVNRCGPKKGKKFYLLQHFETWGGPQKDVVASYSLGLHLIVNSRWLQEKIEKASGIVVKDIILHAPDWEEFYPVPGLRKEDSPVRVLMAYRHEDWKGASDGLAVFETVKRSYPDIRLVLFGSSGQNIPADAEFHRSPTNKELRELYNSCDIFIFSSWHEGFGMPPMEAMACTCAVVTTNVGAVPDYCIPGITALVSEPRDVEGMARNLRSLVADRAYRLRIAQAGYAHIRQFTWENAALRLENVFKGE